MSAQVIASATAIGVAVLGAGATIYNTRSTQRQQREAQAAHAGSAALAERVVALTELGTAAAAFIAASSELVTELTPGNREPARCLAKHDAYQARWTRLREARLPARSHAATDRALAALIDALDQATGVLHTAVVAWFQQVKRYDWQIDKRSPENIETARQACEQLLEQFEASAAAPTDR